MFAERLGIIYVGTRADAGKLKRLRHSERVMLAPCTYGGKVTGAEMAGKASILTEPEEYTVASSALTRKYGIMLPLTRTVWRLLHRKAKAAEIYIAIEPLSG